MDAPRLGRRDRGSLTAFPSGLAHSERPLSLTRHGFASRSQDGRHALVADPVAFGYYLGGLSRRSNRETAHCNSYGQRRSRARAGRRCGRGSVR